ncbi:MAG TPA: NAD(P)/FAD-dependent oxidoreductase [Candidatus Dormibacteraeota bacterium]|nr:NAD(P)/FAD-dependent oxidoreductase [Candidatus Dormibacteraeota bacterium]
MAELLVVGGGPAGVAAAITAAGLGARVTLVERSQVGGTHVQRGEVPAARLRYLADLLEEIGRAEELGVRVVPAIADWGRMRAAAAAAAEAAAARTRAALRAAGVEVVAAGARFLGPGRMEAGGLVFERMPVVLATGAASIVPQRSGAPRPGRRVVTGDEVMTLDQVPSRLLIAGGGRLGLEWATLFSRLGSRVTVAMAGDRLLPGEEAEMANALRVALERRGLRFLSGRGALERAEAELEPEVVLFADSRLPGSSGLDLEAAGVATGPSGEVTVDTRCATSTPGVFAAGDLTGPPWLWGRARAQGRVAATCALGGRARFRPERVPRTVHTRPELAAVGLTEEEATARGARLGVGHGRLGPDPGEPAPGGERGWLKLIVDTEFGEILGAHMLGCRASEAIGLVATAMELEAHYRDLVRVHPRHHDLAGLIARAVASIR